MKVTLRRRPLLCSFDLRCVGFPVPWQEFCETRLRYAGDAGEGVGEPGLRVDAVHFCGLIDTWMAKSLSSDVRVRVLAAIDGGLSCRRALRDQRFERDLLELVAAA